MPEGDAVRRTARRLDAALAGQVLTRAELRVPRFATFDLRGMTVLGTEALGKHLLTRLVEQDRAWTLHSHLRLDGAWRTGPLGQPGAPQHLIRAWLTTPTHQAVGVRVHMIGVLPTAQESAWIGHLGPDVMAEDFDTLTGASRLTADSGQLVVALLDQRLVCGLGTMWAAELAWAIRHSPFQPVQAVAPGDLATGLSSIRKRMLAAVEDPRLVARRGLEVFERTGRPCRRCGTPIRRGRIGVPPQDRPTYWCPTCQPDPGQARR